MAEAVQLVRILGGAATVRHQRGEVSSPRMSTIRKLAEGLEVDPAELVE